jgi:NAD dependent epimerase/dehydratase family enzyme
MGAVGAGLLEVSWIHTEDVYGASDESPDEKPGLKSFNVVAAQPFEAEGFGFVLFSLLAAQGV